MNATKLIKDFEKSLKIVNIEKDYITTSLIIIWKPTVRSSPIWKNQRVIFAKKVFKSEKILKKHTTTVHEDKKHKCESCGSSFPAKYNLERHMKNLMIQISSLSSKIKTKSKNNHHKVYTYFKLIFRIVFRINSYIFLKSSNIRLIQK